MEVFNFIQDNVLRESVLAIVGAGFLALLKVLINYVFLRWLGGKAMALIDILIVRWLRNHPRERAIYDHYIEKAKGNGHNQPTPYHCADGECYLVFHETRNV